jgi:DNA polymerase-3 subunit epsilon
MSGYLVFDTETTGLPEWSAPADAPHQPRLASLAMLALDDDLEIEDRVYHLVQPDGWTMPAELQRLHGLTNLELEAQGLPIDYVANLFAHGMIDRTLVAHNLQFDTKIMRGELRRIAQPEAAEKCRTGICTMRALTQACGILKPNGSGLKFPKLAEACRIILKRDLVGAHNALADAKACLWLLRAMRERGLLEKVAA